MCYSLATAASCFYPKILFDLSSFRATATASVTNPCNHSMPPFYHITAFTSTHSQLNFVSENLDIDPCPHFFQTTRSVSSQMRAGKTQDKLTRGHCRLFLYVKRQSSFIPVPHFHELHSGYTRRIYDPPLCLFLPSCGHGIAVGVSWLRVSWLFLLPFLVEWEPSPSKSSAFSRSPSQWSRLRLERI